MSGSIGFRGRPMTQLEPPLCSVFVVRVQSTVDITVPAESGKEAKKLVEQQIFPRLANPKIMAVYRSDMMPAAGENEGGPEVPPKPPTKPKGRPSGGGSQGGGSTKPILKPVDAIANVA